MFYFLFRLFLLYILITFFIKLLHFVIVLGVQVWRVHKATTPSPQAKRTFHGKEVIDVKFKEVKG